MAKNLKTNKETIALFKKSLIEVAAVRGSDPSEISRDSYIETAIEHNLVRLNKAQLNDIGGFRSAKNLFFPKKNIESDVSKIDVSSYEQDMIIKLFIKYLEHFNKLPTLQELESFSDIKLNTIKKYYSSTPLLFDKVIKDHPEYNSLVLNENSFTEDYLKLVKDKIKKSKRFVITTAVAGKKVDELFFSSLKNYAERVGAEILVLPCEDVQNKKKSSSASWDLDPKLSGCSVIFDDIYLNSNLYLSNIKVSAKQVLPLTGLDRFVHKYGSMIVASTKQFMKFLPKSNKKSPRAIMTTGAVTENDYNFDFFMSKRTSKIAESDHINGAIIVEIQDDNIFHFRQVQSSEIKSITDLGIEYLPDGSINKLEGTVAVFGDIHCGNHNEKVHLELKNIVRKLNIHDIVLHDVFDGNSITHHDLGKPAVLAAKYMSGQSSLEKEGRALVDYLNNLGACIDGDIIIVPSNHNEFLDRYLTECRFIYNAENLYYSLDLCKKLIEGYNPLQYMIEEKIGLSKDITVKWLKREDDYNVYGIECGQHGDAGINGAKGNATSIEKAYGNCIIGHSHSGQIYRGVYVVGTSSNLLLDYNKKGASSWGHTCALVYSNGTRQLINIVQDSLTKEYSWRL